MKFGVRTHVGESAGCRNDFKTWKERRGIVTVCFSLFAAVARARIPVRVRAQRGLVRPSEESECPGISGTQKF